MSKIMCIRSVLMIGVLASPLVISGLLSHAEDRQDAERKGANEEGYSAVLDQMKIPRNRLTRDSQPADLAKWPKDGAIYGGLKVERVKGREAGLPIDRLPGAKSMSLSEVKQMDVAKQRTGLFLVDIDFVPRELPAALRSRGLTLEADGTLRDGNQEPVVAFVTSEMYRVNREKQEPGATPSASPFRFACYSFTPWAIYHGGFHRWYEAHTLAIAYGPDGMGGCSSGSPHTRIDYLQARAAVRQGGDFQQCFGCDQVQANDVWDVGYFWPAHGIPVTSHSAVWADGTFSFSRTAFLTW
jgi:hypothetical protein